MGITLTYGLTRIVNFAQGEIVTAGAFGSFILTTHGVPIALAIPISAVIVGLLAEVVLDLGVFRRTLDRPLNGFIVSLGLILALEEAYTLKWGTNPFELPAILGGTWRIGSVTISRERTLLTLVTIVVAGGLLALIEFTKFGRAMRALAENRRAAQLLGVPVGRLISWTFVLGSALAALAGGLLGTLFSFSAFTGSTFLLSGFAVAIIGGLGSVRGAILAALIVGVCETLGAAYVSLLWAPAFGLLAMLVTILIRPQGLFRGTEVEGGAALSGADLTGILAKGSTHAVAAWRRRPEIPRAAALAVFALVCAGAFTFSIRNLSLGAYALVCAIGAYGIWFCFRYAGIFSVGQGAMVGIGAYAAGLSSSHWHAGFWLEMLIAIAASGLLSLVIGTLMLRASGSHGLILLFASAQLVIVVLTNWTSLTGGDLGLIQLNGAKPFGNAVDFNNYRNYYLLVFGILCVVVAILWSIGRSAFGQRLTTIRDNEELARSLGLNTAVHKIAAFVIAGMAGGIAGVLFLYSQRGIQPELFDAFLAINLALMMIVGGVGTLVGPLVGAFVITFLPIEIQISRDWGLFANGIVLIAIIIFLPLGIVGTLMRLWREQPVALPVRRALDKAEIV